MLCESIHFRSPLLTLLTPTALLALTGLLVPVAIHLWNRRPGREVAVGSLRWLAAGANRRLRNLKPEQLWLLLLRAALLAVLAVAVAGPVWRQQQPASRGVVLLSAEVPGTPAFAAVRSTIDSLRRRGYVVRWLAAGFPKVSEAMWRAEAAGRRDSARLVAEAGRPTNHWLWARVEQAAAAFAGQPLYVVAPAALAGFEGSHRPLRANITWQALADTATATWLAAADVVGDSLHLLVGRSSETQTTFRRQKVGQQLPFGQRIRVAGLAPLRFQPSTVGDKNPVLIPANAAPGLAAGVVVRVLPMIIEIYSTPEYAADARYLEAALRAAAVGLTIPPLLHRVKARPANIASGWTFWLSNEPLPQEWQKDRRNEAHVWQEAAGPGVADTARLATSAPDATPVTIFRRGTGASPKAARPLWADGQGRAVLTRQALGQGAIYRLNTRLNPKWSTLADDPALPAHLLALLQPASTDDWAAPAVQAAPTAAAHDHRALDPTQLILSRRPSITEKNPLQSQDSASAQAFRFTDLRPWLVLAAGLLFLLERLLARRREVRAMSLSTSTTSS